MESNLNAWQSHIMKNSRTVALILLNVAGVVGIVILIKQLFQGYHFQFPIFLLSLHQGSTALALAIGCYKGWIEPKKLDTKTTAVLAAGEVGSIVFSNFSLLYNSVGMYQIYKLLNIPFMCVVGFFMSRTTYSTPIKASLALILLGIGLATVADVQYSFWGVVHGTLAVVATSVYQVQVKEVTKREDMTGLQVSHATALYKTLGLVFLTPILERDPMGLLSFDYTPWIVSLIIMTCFLGIIAVATPAMIIQKTTPVTFQVVGHAKTCMVILAGFLFFAQPVVAKNIIGVLLALVGMVWYSHLNMPTKSATAPKLESMEDSVEIEEEDPPVMKNVKD